MLDPTTTKVWYDTREGFEKALKGGLGGLKEISVARSEAYYDRKERLSWWLVLSHFIFDECGNTMVITENPPDYHTFKDYVPRVLTKEEWQKGNIDRPMSYTMGSIPPTVKTCPRCLEGWDLRNVATHKTIRTQDDVWVHYHKKCHDLKVLQDEVTFFTKILEDSGIKYTEIRLIPAEYPDRPTAPWFMVVTPKGTIKIGYRRSVISISWEHSTLNVDGNVLFEKNGVTTDKSLVHAWGTKKAASYLQRLFAASEEEPTKE